MLYEGTGEAKDCTTYPHVVVDIEKVRAYFVKDTIGLDQHDEKGIFSTTGLREAVKTTRDFDSRWSAYCDTAGEPKVLPLMVIQVPDKSDSSKISEIVQVVESEWPGLGPNAIAHVFGEHEPVVLGSRIVSWVCPRIYHTDTNIRVVLAKEAILTGWDCPRAEVLYSERPAKDATHIAQVIRPYGTTAVGAQNSNRRCFELGDVLSATVRPQGALFDQE